MLAILSPTPAAVNNTPKEANNCGNIENTPIAWNILLVSSTASDGLALVIANANNKESVDAIPIATVPGNSVNEATSIAITAIDKAGTNIFKPNF